MTIFFDEYINIVTCKKKYEVFRLIYNEYDKLS